MYEIDKKLTDLVPARNGATLNVDEDKTLELYEQLVECRVGAAGITVTLPPVSQAVGRIYSIFLRSTGGGSVTVADQDDSISWSDITLNALNEGVVLFSTGSQWVELAGDSSTGYYS